MIPALDIIDNKIVRLYQGDYQQQTSYQLDPIAQLTTYVKAGATQIHLVDLDGAKDPKQRQFDFFKKLIKTIKEINPQVIVQAGGGIRTTQEIEQLLGIGLDRVVIGSTAVKDPQLTQSWFKQFGAEQLVLALDVRIIEQQPLVATHGWLETSDLSIAQIIELYPSAKYLLCTDIAKDGTLTGPNLELYKSLKAQFPQLVIQASGGISNLDDLKNLQQAKIDQVIIGKALLENKFTIEEAVACWQNA